MKRKKCICHARENTGKREWIKVYEHPPLWKSDNNNNNKVLLWYLKTPEAISSTSVLYKNCMNTRYCKSWQKGLIINVVAIRRWKLAILSDLSTRGDYHSQIYTKAANSNWCLNVIHASVMQGCFLLWIHGWFTFQKESTFTIWLHVRFAQKERTQMDVYNSLTSRKLLD